MKASTFFRTPGTVLTTTLALLLLLASGSEAAGAQEASQALEPGSELTVYLMTMGPGDLVWERFGHNAIWVSDAAAGTEVAYNYGMFSFEQENFILRFIQGQMDYWMEGFDAELTAAGYARFNRSVWAQELNLTPRQRVEIRDFLAWNAQPENRFYRYDYYRDNCSTRVRDAIDLVLGGQLRAQTETVGSGSTYRDHTRRLTADDALIYTGLMAALGQPVDREISVWEEMFLPMQMRERMRAVSVDDGSGGRAPLVVAETEIFGATRAPDPAVPPTRIPTYLIAGLALGGVLWLSARHGVRNRGARAAFAGVASLWIVVAGTLGVALFALWATTAHVSTYRNANLFFFSPFLLPLLGLLPGILRGHGRAAAAGLRLAVFVAVVSLLGFLLGFLPPFSQTNGELIALALPINLALAAGVWELARGRRGPGGSPARMRTRGDEPIRAVA